MDELVSIRQQLQLGDLRALYIAWLAAASQSVAVNKPEITSLVSQLSDDEKIGVLLV